ncbi:MAG: hypothetical protein Q9227_000494 [Pyrenula ochraceoflavens]
MDNVQSKAVAALQPFIVQAQTTKAPSPRFVADIISRATAAPNTYVFTELLQLPAIQSLRSEKAPDEFAAYLTQLELFAWGTWAEYQTYSDLPPLNEAQTLKLRQLSLLSLAASPAPLTYPFLMKELHLSTPQDLETLVTSAVYASLLTARLSPASKPPCVHVTSVAPVRDLRPGSLPEMLQILETWGKRCTGVVTEIEGQIKSIKEEAAVRKRKEVGRQEIVDEAVWKEGGEGGVGGGSILSGITSGGNNKSGGGRKDSFKSPTEDRKGKGSLSGNKRDIQEQQSDELEEGDEDGGVGVGVSRMEVDEGTKESGGGGRLSKRVFGKKS